MELIQVKQDPTHSQVLLTYKDTDKGDPRRTLARAQRTTQCRRRTGSAHCGIG